MSVKIALYGNGTQSEFNSSDNARNPTERTHMSQIDFHETVVNAMCEYPHEMRFGTLYKIVNAYESRLGDGESSLDTVRRVVSDLVASGDIILQKAPPPSGFGFRQNWYIVRSELIKNPGVSTRRPMKSTRRDLNVPLNYKKEKINI